jgi:hypothetical protein
MRRLKLIAAIGLVFALGAAGCGKDEPKLKSAGSKGLGVTSSTTASTVPGAKPGTNGGPGANGGTAPTTPGANGTGGQQTGGGPTTTAKAKVQPTYTIDKKCLKVGETQGLTVKTSPKDAIGYSSEYSDKSTSFSNHYSSGDGTGQADDAGNYRATWQVPLNAPPGKALLHVVAGGDFQSPLEFMIVSSTGKC